MYTAHGQLSLDTLIRQHAPLVRRIAQHMMARLPPSVELDDLIQVGMIGLADALSRYETSHGVQFETFASQRIRGAMLDELRGSDWMSRSARKGQKDIESAIHRLEQSLGRAPKESEIAEAMELELAEYQELLGRVRGTQLIYLEDMGQNGDEGENFLDRHVADAQADPFAQLRDHRLRQALVALNDAVDHPSKATFMAGLVVAESEYSHSALEGILPFRDVFTSIFFISVGMLMDMNFFIDNVGMVLVVALLVLAVATTLATQRTLVGRDAGADQAIRDGQAVDDIDRNILCFL